MNDQAFAATEHKSSFDHALGGQLARLTSAKRSRRQAIILPASCAAMVLGISVAIAAYFVSHLSSDPLVQRDAIVMALAATAFTVASSTVFAVSAITAFLRFWLARLIYTLTVAQHAERDDNA